MLPSLRDRDPGRQPACLGLRVRRLGEPNACPTPASTNRPGSGTVTGAERDKNAIKTGRRRDKRKEAIMAATATLPKQIRDMYDDAGRVDARAIATALGETTAMVARSFHVEPDTVRKNPVTPRIQMRGQRLVGILEELTRYFAGDWKTTMIWFRKPHPDLDSHSPLDIAMEGDLDTIAGLVHAFGTGEPG